MGIVIFVAGMFLSVFMGFRAGSVLNWQTIAALLVLQFLGYYFYGRQAKGREIGNNDVYALGIICCFFLFSATMVFTAVAAMKNLDNGFVDWIRNLTYR